MGQGLWITVLVNEIKKGEGEEEVDADDRTCFL